MIAAQNIGVEFSGIPLFSGINFTINRGDRVGLVGSNGAGKTTLMRILNREQTPTEGEIVRQSSMQIGYLKQEPSALGNSSVRDEVLSALGDLVETEKRIAELGEEISTVYDAGDAEAGEKLLAELGELQHRFDGMDGFSARGDVEKILMGLGFLPEDLDRPCSEFSGGWQMRIELAKLLLVSPDLLMLDEPTNHLDIESLTWLEEFLGKYPGAILLISHDRVFLDALVTRTFEMSAGALTLYTGNYSRYVEERKERRALQLAAYLNQQKMIADTERFIERFRYKASKAVQVQSRVKQLEKLERLTEPEPEEAQIAFDFPPAPRSGRVVLELESLTKAYGDHIVLENVDLALERGAKVAFLGRNGEGKSTLSRIIAGTEPFEGTRTVGHNVDIGYFAQHQAEELDPKLTVLETLESVARGEIRTRLRTLLGAFLFRDDDVFKPVSVLSGGEKSRLALAKLLLEPRNLLVFDEPTNHLDMPSKNVLKGALQRFEGTLVIVSHDRDFLSGLADLCIDFRNRAITEHIGGIEDYLRRRGVVSVDDAFAPQERKKRGEEPKPVEQDGLSRKEQKRIEAEKRNRRHAATKELKKEVDTLEKKVGWLESEKEELEAKLADPEIYADQEKAVPLQKRLSTIVEELPSLYKSWESAAGRLEAVVAEAEEET